MKNRTRYVYFDKKRGFITDILDVRKRGRAKYVVCDVNEVIGFLSGEWGMTDYIVAFDNKIKDHRIFKKDNIIRLRKPSKDLIKIPYKKHEESVIRLVYYSDNVLEVSIDMEQISPLYQTNFRDEVRFEKGTELRIVLREKDSGNLLKELVIDAQDLANSVQMFFELYDHIYQDNVEFFTYGLFESYSWSKGVVKLTSPIKDRIKFEIHKADFKRRTKDFEYHLVIEPTETGIRIKNNIESAKLIRMHQDIVFFVVDRHDPNILYEKFFVSEEDIESSTILISLDTDVSEKAILYNNKYISVLKEG